MCIFSSTHMMCVVQNQFHFDLSISSVYKIKWKKSLIFFYSMHLLQNIFDWNSYYKSVCACFFRFKPVCFSSSCLVNIDVFDSFRLGRVFLSFFSALAVTKTWAIYVVTWWLVPKLGNTFRIWKKVIGQIFLFPIPKHWHMLNMFRLSF